MSMVLCIGAWDQSRAGELTLADQYQVAAQTANLGELLRDPVIIARAVKHLKSLPPKVDIEIEGAVDTGKDELTKYLEKAREIAGKLDNQEERKLAENYIDYVAKLDGPSNERGAGANENCFKEWSFDHDVRINVPPFSFQPNQRASLKVRILEGPEEIKCSLSTQAVHEDFGARWQGNTPVFDEKPWEVTSDRCSPQEEKGCTFNWSTSEYQLLHSLKVDVKAGSKFIVCCTHCNKPAKAKR